MTAYKPTRVVIMEPNFHDRFNRKVDDIMFKATLVAVGSVAAFFLALILSWMS